LAYSRPNYTQVANIFMDKKMSNCSGAEVKVFLAISRKTIGWHKISEKISYSQLKEMTGLSVNAMKKAIAELLEKDLITQWQIGQNYWYDLAISENDTVETISENDMVNNETVSENDIVDPKTISENDTTKESNKRNNIKKVDERLKPYILLAKLLYSLHKKIDDKYLNGKDVEVVCAKWAKDIRLLVEKDGRDIAEVEQVIRWAKTEGNFWFVNIMSGAKLRLQYSKLILQMKQGGKKSGNFKGTDKELHNYDEFFGGKK